MGGVRLTRRRSGRSRGARQGRGLPGHRRRLWAWNAIPCATSASGTGWMEIRGLQAMTRRKTRPAALPAASPSPSPREAGAEDSAATPAAARGGQHTPSASSRRCGDLFQDLRLLRKDISGVWKRPPPYCSHACLFQTASTRQGRTGVQLSNRYLDIRPHMSDV